MSISFLGPVTIISFHYIEVGTLANLGTVIGAFCFKFGTTKNCKLHVATGQLLYYVYFIFGLRDNVNT